jgi:hypothetical protein
MILILPHVLEPCYICLTLDQTFLMLWLSLPSIHGSFATVTEIFERQHVFGIEV